MTHRNKKERLSEVLIRLGCESKKALADKIKDIFSVIYFINIFILFLYLTFEG